LPWINHRRVPGRIIEPVRAANPHCTAAVQRHPAIQEKLMGINKDQVKGRVTEAKGKIKEVAGKLVGNPTLEAKGKVQKIAGKAQAKFGDVRKDVKDAM
jgi:uncharacterized protein YjbJ (UPF0337 family)